MKRLHALRSFGACANAAKATILRTLVKWATMACSEIESAPSEQSPVWDFYGPAG
jgi:hypothetical protein